MEIILIELKFGFNSLLYSVNSYFISVTLHYFINIKKRINKSFISMILIIEN